MVAQRLVIRAPVPSRRPRVTDARIFGRGQAPHASREVRGSAAFRDRLSDEERGLADLRAAGREWADIAREVGGTAEARRKQLTRAISRVCKELGLEETGDE